MKYIKTKQAVRKLIQAERSGRPIYIYGRAGAGKSRAVNEFLNMRGLTGTFIGCEAGALKRMPDPDSIYSDFVVFEHVSRITDEESQKYIVNMLRNVRLRVIIEGRRYVPDWLRIWLMARDFTLIGEEDMTINSHELLRLMKAKSGQLSDDEFEQILDDCMHNSYLEICVLNHLDEKGYSERVLDEAFKEFDAYLQKNSLDYFNAGIQEYLVIAGYLDSFTIKLGEMLTGDADFGGFIERMKSSSDLIEDMGDGKYAINPLYRDLCRRRVHEKYSEQRKQTLYGRIGLYFELNGDMVRALDAYDKAGDTDKIGDVLSRIAIMNPDMEHFRDIEKYFAKIPLSTIESRPALISAVSMMQSLTFDIDGSERWYRKLKSFAEDESNNQVDRKEALYRLKTLDVILPHRDHSRVTENIEVIAEQRANNYVSSFFVTDYTPSLISGGIDLCEAMRDHRDAIGRGAMDGITDEVNSFLGKEQSGYVELVLLEDRIQRGIENEFNATARLNEIYVRADAIGNLELCYVSIYLMAKFIMYNGDLASAKKLVRNFLNKARNAGDPHLVESIEGTLAWMDFYRGNTKLADEWLKTVAGQLAAPDFLSRYTMIVSMRAFMALNDLDEVIARTARMEVVFRKYHRPFMLMQTLEQRAIAFYRQGSQAWRDALSECLGIAVKYGYVMPLADEGASLLPLLEEWDGEANVDPGFWEKLKELTQRMADNYPEYMKPLEVPVEALTPTEGKVMQLMCDGLDSKSICAALEISYNSLKFHKKNIYRKLGVNRQQDAVAKARRLELVED
ncbi:MAG: LuxR C-terminal-related transcriptional regulator [Eubacteriales bacterium]|nr:LuxR C-terminal-related transcriptional regulator [Eubacteriales bacterium]